MKISSKHPLHQLPIQCIKNRYRLSLLALLFMGFSYSAIANKQQPVKSNVKEVTVFLNGAQVHRKGNFQLKRGVSELVFSGISKYVNPKSIQAKGKGAFTILEVRHHVHYPEPITTEEKGLPQHIKRKISLLEDSLLKVSFDLSEIKTHKEALNLEKKILLSTNMANGRGKTADSIPLLKQGMLFFREKLNDINKKSFVLNKKEHSRKALENRMNQRLSILKQYKQNTSQPAKSNEPVQQVIVTVSSSAATAGSLDVNYMVSQAGWSAHYDLRASNTSAPIQLTYKARVYQNSGEDWRNVKLKLSTNNPNLSNTQPSLPIWYIDYYQRQRMNGYNKLSNLSEPVTLENKIIKKEKSRSRLEENQLQDAESIANYTTMAENITSIEFNIKLPYSIKSNGEAHLVEVQTRKLPTQFYHTVIPKVKLEAFVMAKITDWEKLNLLPATANIFFDGTYIGETQINPAQLADTLLVSLGRDASIRVKRSKLKDENKAQIVGNNITKTIAYEITLKNNKSSKIN